MDYVLALFVWISLGALFYFCNLEPPNLIEWNNKKQLFLLALLCGPIAFISFLIWIIWDSLDD